MFAVQETSTASSQVVPKHSEDAGFKIPAEEPDEWLPIKLASRGLLFTLSQLSQRGRVQTFVGAVIAIASLLFLVTKCFSLISPVLESSRGVVSRLLSLAERGSLAGGKCTPEYLRVADAPEPSAAGSSSGCMSSSKNDESASSSKRKTKKASPFSLLLQRPISNTGINRFDVGAVTRQLEILQLSQEDEETLTPSQKTAVQKAAEVVGKAVEDFKALRREYADASEEAERLRKPLDRVSAEAGSSSEPARKTDDTNKLAETLSRLRSIRKEMRKLHRTLKPVLQRRLQSMRMLLYVARSRIQTHQLSWAAAAALSIAASLKNVTVSPQILDCEQTTTKDRKAIRQMVEESLSRLSTSRDALRPLFRSQPSPLSDFRRLQLEIDIAEARKAAREAGALARGLRAFILTAGFPELAAELEAAVRDLSNLIPQLDD